MTGMRSYLLSSNGTLTIDTVSDSNIVDDTQVDNNVNCRSTDQNVWLPSLLTGNTSLDFITTRGDVVWEAQPSFLFDHVNFTATEGDVAGDYLRATSIIMQTGTGSSQWDNLEATFLMLTTTSTPVNIGRVHITNETRFVETVEDYETQTSYDVYEQVYGVMSAEIGTGGIKISRLGGGDFDIRSTSGSIEVTVDYDDFAGTFELVTSKGNIQYQKPPRSQSVEENDSVYGSVCCGNQTLYIQTTSGNIVLNFDTFTDERRRRR
eukprot:TRINITY_DN4787_c0_g1::TRINITY_DN4787_c0_g1_i1::g.21398::m.21398 TRINITY_DN4787_c0_g1::TRINITY_DN4787_c0_g1_i1::g.21398  ORF type:complete len:264 (-),score=69.25,DUF4098/PF13345.1/47,DUF4098/PF13345.1/2.4,DUF4098/PF13345.1/3.6e-05,DUF4098/PF13345.1/22 TRINITY_DN4787_c0_g1_i1:389-1180(-)